MEEKVLVKSERYNIKKFRSTTWIIGAVAAIISFFIQAKNDMEWCMSNMPFSGKELYQYNLWEFITKYEYASPSEYFAGVLIVFASFFLFGLIIYWWLSKIEITVSNKRVYGIAAFGKRVDLPVDSVSAIGSKWPKGIAVATSSGKIAFLMIKNRDEIHKCVSDLLIARQSKAGPTPTIKQEIQQSMADELKKYKELLDSGVISQEEFDAKKKQLLGL